MSFFAAQKDVETRLCTAVNVAIQARDANQLQSIVLLEPTPVFPQDHLDLIDSLHRKYPASDENAETRLEDLVKRVVTETGEDEDEEGRPIQSWSGMVNFLVGWMTYLRDMDRDDYLTLYPLLSELQQKANSALQHPTKGILMLPTIISYANIFARVAVGLDQKPELIQHLLIDTGNEDGPRESLSEKAANIVRQAFITCLNDRNTVPGGVRNGKPDGKKIGIYKMANTCLRIIFKANKPESCETIFKNINVTSPPLHIYPAAERVTYLYFLGRYQFASTNFFAAQLVLQKAFEDCAPHFLAQRRLILVYLVAANLILGRFPTDEVYAYPEAKGFRQVFTPLTQAIRRGDLESFRRITSLDLSHASAEFLCHYRIFYQVGNYCEVLVWRSLIRRVFLLGGAVGGQMQTDARVSTAATIDLKALVQAFRFLEARSKIKNAAMAAQDLGPGRRNFGHVFQDHASTTKSTYIDPDFEGVEDVNPYNHEYDLLEIECICGSLITQGLLNAYISQSRQLLAIQGARKPGGPMKNGFPKPWEVIVEKNSNEVEGWRRDGAVQGGMVINLSGARPAGE